jgi:hypothetical protein
MLVTLQSQIQGGFLSGVRVAVLGFDRGFAAGFEGKKN